MELRHIVTAALLPLACGLVVWTTVATAELYTYLDAHGTRVYTDQRPSGVTYRRVSPPAARTAPRRSAGQIFVYQSPNGARLVTNQRQQEDALTLIATYGRPTASVRCRLAADAVMPVGSGPFDAIITQEARAWNLDPLLIKSVVWVESCFDQYAISRVGAHGLMQLMPATAAELGVTDRFDPAQNIRGGVTYLARMLDRFGQDLDLALAAYNAGPGAVERHKGIPPFTETRNYVARVNAHYQLHAAAADQAERQVAQD
ncbi:transglycosylase SLT domain-containing protein [Thioalkalivibrio sp.]|uniref:transglycosylase SLT domain-containing protein n=1 Tax=Thioalkalivibrio sp. TaxID=2093813 RepID=UPI00397617DD